jgi:hypothetical protein
MLAQPTYSLPVPEEGEGCMPRTGKEGHDRRRRRPGEASGICLYAAARERPGREGIGLVVK